MTDWDLAVITPTRGRPAGLRRLIAALARNSTARVMLAVGLDDDDPALDEYLGLLYPPHDDDLQPIIRDTVIEVAPRMTLAAWTNRFAVNLDGCAQFVASLGDDHEPLTHGWDTKLIAGICSLPGAIGIAYGNDTLQGEALPTAPVMSAEIPAALGYMCPPALAHYYIDNAWRDLGERTGQIRYMPDVIVRHHHPAGSGGRAGWLWDQTYEDAQATWSTGLDHVAYQAWRGDALDAAAARIRALAGAR